MTYTLHRGPRLLGRLEIRQADARIINGVLITAGADVEVVGEYQKHMSPMPELNFPGGVFSMPEEPDVVDGPPRPSGGGSFALQPIGEDAIVKSENMLRVFKDDDEIRVDTVWLRERRYLNDVSADERRQLPSGALRGRSYWTVAVFLDTTGGDTGEADVTFDEPDSLSP